MEWVCFFNKISTIDDANIELLCFENRTETFFLSVITVEQSEVIDIQSTLKVNKATGPDRISHRMLRKTSKASSLPICKLFNLSLKINTYPALWKIAHVMPIFKKGDKSQLGNCRPISLISCVGKSLERILYENVYNHLPENSHVYKYQSGFLPGHWTVYHLIESIHHRGLALENHEINCQLFCDISKAFDRGWHRGLILKLKNMVFGAICYNGLKAIKLTNRSQQVGINDSLSCPKHIHAGAPQGSVLGPFLFLIFINDIADSTEG